MKKLDKGNNRPYGYLLLVTFCIAILIYNEYINDLYTVPLAFRSVSSLITSFLLWVCYRNIKTYYKDRLCAKYVLKTIKIGMFLIPIVGFGLQLSVSLEVYSYFRTLDGFEGSPTAKMLEVFFSTLSMQEVVEKYDCFGSDWGYFK